MEHSAQLLNKTVSQGIQYLWTQVALVYDDPNSEKSRNFFNDLPNILFIILGGQNKKGWLTQCFEDAYNPSRFSSCNDLTLLFLDKNAEENIRQLIQLLSPQAVRNGQRANLYTLLFQRQIADGYRFQLQASVLPDHLQELRRNCVWKHPTVSRFANMFESPNSSGMSSQMMSSVVLCPGDWFLFAFAFNLKTSRPVYGMNKRFKAESSSDIYAEELTKNPFLVLLRHYLEFFHEQTFSEFNDTSKRGSNFRKLSFIVEEYLIGESLFELNPQHSIQMQLHYSILEGIQTDQLRKLQESSFQQNAYLSQILQQQQQQSPQKMYSLQGSTDPVDQLSGYSRSNVQSNILAACSIPAFANRKSKGTSISQSYPATFQALIILLHLKRKHFRLLSLYNTNNNSLLRKGGNLSYGQQSQIMSSSSQSGSFIQQQQNQQGMYSSQLSNSSQLRSSISRSSQQPLQNLQQQYQPRQSNFKEQERKLLSNQACNLEYFREEGEDTMLSLTFKKLSLFLSTSLEERARESSKSQPSDSLYDHSRLLLSLLGHFNYFTSQSCEQELFEYLAKVDEQSDFSNFFKSFEQGIGMSNSLQPPLRPSMYNFQLRNGDFEMLLPPGSNNSMNKNNNNRFRQSQANQSQQYYSIQQQQSQLSSFKEQIGFFNDELSALRFKMFSSAATFLTNRYLQAVSSQKEISLPEISQLCVLLDVLCDGFQDEDVVSRLNSLDIVTLRYSCELFMLRENSEDAFSLFCTHDSLQVFHRLSSLIAQFLKKKGLSLNQSNNNDLNSFQGAGISLPIMIGLSSDITDPVEIVQHFKNILDALHARALQNNAQSNNFSSSSLNDTLKQQEDYSSQILNKRKPYDFNSWSAPLSSFESSLLFFIALQLSFFIDFIKTGQRAAPNTKYPKTNLRKLANFYFTISALLLIGFVFFVFNIFYGNSSSQQTGRLSYQGRNSNQNFKTSKDFGIED